MKESLNINIKIHPGLYKYYKGGIYEVLENAKHSETLEDMVVYRSTEDEKIWVKPSTKFIEPMSKDKNSISRFTFIKK